MAYINIATVCLFITNINCLDTNLYSTFSFDEDFTVLGVESSIKDFISLANDPKSRFPESFTICSSILLKFENVVTHGAHFVQIYTENGSHWFSYQLVIVESLNLQTALFYMDPSTGTFHHDANNEAPIPVIPHSWYHVCLGLDTVSGHLRIVINGVTVVDMEKLYFKNTTAITPKSLIGKVTGKIFVFQKI